MTGDERRDTVEFEPGRVPLGARPAGPECTVYSGEDVMWGVYGMTEWLAHTWSATTDERLDALITVTNDLGDRMHLLARLVVVALCTTIAAVGALLGAVLLTR